MEDAKRYYDSGLYQSAKNHYALLLYNRPMDPEIAENIGWCDYKLGRPFEATLAFESAIRFEALKRAFGLHSPPLSSETYHTLAYSYAVQGHYAQAVGVLEKSLSKYPWDDRLRELLVAMTAAHTGLDAAATVYSQWWPNREAALQMPGRYYPGQAFDIADNWLTYLANQAGRDRNRYAQLTHLAAVHRLVGDLSYRVSDTWRIAEQEKLMREMGAVYRVLPLKPVPVGAAHQHALAAQQHLDREEWHEAITRYGSALRLAPWWADGHYNRGLLYEATEYAYPGAIEAFENFLLLVPDGRHSSTVRSKLSRCRRELDAMEESGYVTVPGVPGPKPPIGPDVRR